MPFPAAEIRRNERLEDAEMEHRQVVVIPFPMVEDTLQLGKKLIFPRRQVILRHKAVLPVMQHHIRDTVGRGLLFPRPGAAVP